MSPGEILATSKDHKPPTTPTIKTINRSIHPSHNSTNTTPTEINAACIRIRGHHTQQGWRAVKRSSSEGSESPWYCIPSAPKNTAATARLFYEAFRGDGQPPVAGQTAPTINSRTGNQPQLPPMHNNHVSSLLMITHMLWHHHFMQLPLPSHSPLALIVTSDSLYRCLASSHWY